MNILILNWKDIKHPQVGGAEIIVYELAKRLVAAGHKVTWFCRQFPGGVRFEDIDGISMVRRGNLLSMYIYAPIYYWSLKLKPELVVDISNTIYWQSPLWAIFSKKIAYLNQLAQEVFFYEYPPLISRLGMLLERYQYVTYRNTSFICYSPSTKQDLISVGRIPAKNVHTFNLGVDHERYTPGKKSRTPLFICVNRLVKMKRTDLVIRAMAILVKKHPESKLVIVGTGYDRSRLENLRQQLNLLSNVHFSDEDVWFFSRNPKDLKVKLMQQAWALVFPSIKEGWGMTVTECAACATPAIVSNVSGLKDSVIKNKTGIILSSNPDPSEIYKAMEDLIINKNLRMRLSRQAHYFSQKLNWEKSYTQFLKLVTSL